MSPTCAIDAGRARHADHPAVEVDADDRVAASVEGGGVSAGSARDVEDAAIAGQRENVDEERDLGGGPLGLDAAEHLAPSRRERRLHAPDDTAASGSGGNVP